MGISSGYWAGFGVNLQIVQILCENLVLAAGASTVRYRGDTTGHQPPELPALIELDSPTFPLSSAQL